MKKKIYFIIKFCMLHLGILSLILKIRIRYTKGISVLMIHQGHNGNCDTLPILSVSYQNFSLIYKFINRYFTIITPGQYLDHLLNKTELPFNSLLLTLDDGYKNIEPLLDTISQNGDSAIIFPVTGHISTDKTYWWDVTYSCLKAKNVRYPGSNIIEMQEMSASDRDILINSLKEGIPAETFKTVPTSLTWQQLKEWKAKGMEIGSHSDSHLFMHQHSLKEVEAEISTSQQILKEKLGTTPTWFAFPAGFDFPNSEEILKKHNFLAAFSTVAGIASCNQYFLKRINISDELVENPNGDFSLAEATWRFFLAK